MNPVLEKLTAVERVLCAASRMSAPDSRRVLMLICTQGMTASNEVEQLTEGQKHYAKRLKSIQRTKESCDRVLDYAKHETLRKIEKHFRDTPPIRSAEGDDPVQSSLAGRLTFDRSGFSDDLLAALREDIRLSLIIGGQQLLDEVGFDDPFTMPDAESISYLDQRANLLANTSDEIHQEVMNTIQEGIENGDSRKELMSRITSKMGAISKSRAETIANTETAAAFSYARNKAMVEAGVTHKKWLHSSAPMDEPRPTHVDADGQIAKVDKPFNVSGVKFMYPTDDSLGAGPEDIINCHCVAIPYSK